MQPLLPGLQTVPVLLPVAVALLPCTLARRFVPLQASCEKAASSLLLVLALALHLQLEAA